MGNYVMYHLHTDRSLLDSCTNYKDYIAKAKELGQSAICFSEHGNLYSWVAKKLACEEAGIKYIHGVEMYLTRTHEEKVRDNYHTILIARNYKGVQELNSLVSLAAKPDHFYFKPRLSFDEFLGISDNIITTSACLASPLNRLDPSDEYFRLLANKYTYYEVQPHDHPDQIEFNRRLLELSKMYGKPLIAGTDTHNLSQYKAECRAILMQAKQIAYADEDSFDLTYKSYDELVEMFAKQNMLAPDVYMQAIENTNAMAESVEDFQLDKEFKYPLLYGSADADAAKYREVLREKFQQKVDDFIIMPHQIADFEAALEEETRVLDKINMLGFMLFMSEIVCWCKSNGIPIGFNRGSCGGSRVAYVLDITDLNPETWHTVFSRFANESRKEIGDIDIDIAPDDRDKVYDYIINRFGRENTAYILALGTVNSKGCIDEIARALSSRYKDESPIKNPYSLDEAKKIKEKFETDEAGARETWPELFYYYDGIVNTVVSQSLHPAGIVVSPITLPDNYGCFEKDGKQILQIDMEEIHEISLVKYDLLALKNIQIIRDCCSYAGIPYPKSHDINWEDQDVWRDMLRSPVGIFQMEGDYAFTCLRMFRPRNIYDMSLVTAALRPSGASYRDRLLKRQKNKNPSAIIDEMLAPNLGYLIYQEDTIKFLQEICGLSGSEADNIRRAIGRKDEERLNAALPSIMEGYCAKSDKPRADAEEEANAFLQIIKDSASYQFGYNHSVGYCMIGYMCAYLRYYYPMEFLTAFLNAASNDDDIANGYALAREYGIQIKPPKFGMSGSTYFFDRDTRSVYMGTSYVKFLNETVSEELRVLGSSRSFTSFVAALFAMKEETSINSRQLDILIRIGYFSQFGSVGKLKAIVKAMDYFKYGTAKVIKRHNPYAEIVNVSLAVENDPHKKRITIRDCPLLLLEIEQDISSKEWRDSLGDMMRDQIEFCGGIQPTGKDEDRYLLYINNVKPARRKSDGKQFGVVVSYTSVGTGKGGFATIMSSHVRDPLDKGYIIKTRPHDWKKSGAFYNINNYTTIDTAKQEANV